MTDWLPSRITRTKRGDKRKQQRYLVTTITGPQAQALRRVMGKDLNLRAKKVAGEIVMEVYVDAKDWPFHNKNPSDDNKNNDDDDDDEEEVNNNTDSSSSSSYDKEEEDDEGQQGQTQTTLAKIHTFSDGHTSLSVYTAKQILFSR